MIIDSGEIDLDSYIETLGLAEGEKIVDIRGYYKHLLEYADHGDQFFGDALPWAKTHNTIRLGEGQLSIWAGTAGSGKSLLLGQVMTSMMLSDRKVCIASMEMQPHKTVHRMISQSATCHAARQYCAAWMANFAGKLYVYDRLDSVRADRIIGMVHYAAHELKCAHIVIDSLTKCGMARDDYTAQAKFVDKLQWAAKAWGVHIHLVCHMRKPSTPGHREGRNDIRGAAEIVDLADNVFILRRNKEKEKHAELREHGYDYDREKVEQPCAFLAVEKNREYGIETEFGLWYHRDSGQFSGVPNKFFNALEFDFEHAA